MSSATSLLVLSCLFIVLTMPMPPRNSLASINSTQPQNLPNNSGLRLMVDMQEPSMPIMKNILVACSAFLLPISSEHKRKRFSLHCFSFDHFFVPLHPTAVGKKIASLTH